MGWKDIQEFARTRKGAVMNDYMVYVNDLKFFTDGEVYYCSDRNALQTLICDNRDYGQMKAMIEAVTNTAILTDQMKLELKKYVEEYEVDYNELTSYVWNPTSNPCDGSTWNKYEELALQKDHALRMLEKGNIFDLIDSLTTGEIEEDCKTHYLTDQAIKFVESL